MERNRDPRSQQQLGKAIRVLREKAGFGQVELGGKAGLHPTWISRVESGQVNITWGNLRRIAAGLGVELEALVSLARDFEIADATAIAILRIRHERGLSQASVAERAGLKCTDLAEIESGASHLLSSRVEGKLRRGLRIRVKRWNEALNAAKDELGFV